MSSARHTVVRAPSLIAGGYLPLATPAHHEDGLTGMTERICRMRRKPVCGIHKHVFVSIKCLREFFSVHGDNMLCPSGVDTSRHVIFFEALFCAPALVIHELSSHSGKHISACHLGQLLPFHLAAGEQALLGFWLNATVRQGKTFCY